MESKICLFLYCAICLCFSISVSSGYDTNEERIEGEQRRREKIIEQVETGYLRRFEERARQLEDDLEKRQREREREIEGQVERMAQEREDQIARDLDKLQQDNERDLEQRIERAVQEREAQVESQIEKAYEDQQKRIERDIENRGASMQQKKEEEIRRTTQERTENLEEKLFENEKARLKEEFKISLKNLEFDEMAKFSEEVMASIPEQLKENEKEAGELHPNYRDSTSLKTKYQKSLLKFDALMFESLARIADKIDSQVSNTLGEVHAKVSKSVDNAFLVDTSSSNGPVKWVETKDIDRQGRITGKVDQLVAAEFDSYEKEVLAQEGFEVGGNSEGGDEYVFMSPMASEFGKKNQALYWAFRKIKPLNEQGIAAKKVGMASVKIADEEYSKGNEEEASVAHLFGVEMLDIALGTIPGISAGKDIYELFTGKNLVTGKDLDDVDRTVALFGIASLGTFAYLKTPLKTVLKVVDKVELKSLMKIGNGVKSIIGSARKYGLKTKQQVSKFTDLLKRTVGNETGAWGKIDEWIEPVGKALIQTKPRVSNHALQRFAERGITEGMVNKSIEKGTKYLDKLNKSVSYVLEGGFASGKTMQTVVDMGENTVITVNRIRKFNKNTKLPDGTFRWIEVPSLK